MKNLLKVSPVFVLAYLVITGTDILIAAPIAAIYAIIIGRIVTKHTVDDLIEAAVENTKSGMMTFFILLVAYALVEVFMMTGVSASIVDISIKLGVTARTVALVTFLVSCTLSAATGTSWGTFAACSPIFIWLTHVLGGDVVLTLGAVAGGACFGDNIGLISDTTIFSSGIQKVKVMDRIRYQGVWSLLCIAVASVMFYVTGLILGLPTNSVNAAIAISAIPSDSWVQLEAFRPSAVTLLQQVKSGVPYYMVIPVIVVIVLAVKKVSTLVCLGGGIFSAVVLGYFAGTVGSLTEIADYVFTGMSSAGSWALIMMMMVTAFGGIMNKMDAFEPIGHAIVRVSKNVRQLMTWNGLLCLFGNAALADEVAQIATIGPVIKNVVDNHVTGPSDQMYKVYLRNATFSDAMGILASQMIPWHSAPVFFIALTSAVYPLYDFQYVDLIHYNFFSVISVVSILLLTVTGWDKYVPLFGMPSEPDVNISLEPVQKKVCEVVCEVESV